LCVHTCSLERIMFTHQLLVFNIIWSELFTFYSRSFIINFVKSIYNTEFIYNTDINTTFGIKNYLISSLVPFTYWHNSKYTCFMQFFSSNIKNTVDFMYIQICTKLWQFCIICNAYCNKFYNQKDFKDSREKSNYKDQINKMTIIAGFISYCL